MIVKDPHNIVLLRYNEELLPELIKLFRDTVHHVNRRDYTQAQLDVWAPLSIDSERWQERLSRNYSLVAYSNEQVLGFAELTDTGHVDMLYVHRDFQRRAIGSRLLKALEKHARLNGVMVMTTDASITARPFFERQGYSVVTSQTVTRDQITLVNYKMIKAMLP